MDQEVLCVKQQHKSSFICRCWWKPHKAMNRAVHSHFILWNELPSICVFKSFFPIFVALLYQHISVFYRQEKINQVCFIVFVIVAFEWINHDV